MKPLGDHIAFWNLLHDGVIVGIQGTVPGDVTMEVEISYLRSMLPDPGHKFRVLLVGCHRFELHDMDGNRSVATDQATLVARELEILSAEQRGDTVAVLVAQGVTNFSSLLLQYDSAHVLIESGRAVSLDELAEVCRRYWDRKGREG